MNLCLIVQLILIIASIEQLGVEPVVHLHYIDIPNYFVDNWGAISWLWCTAVCDTMIKLNNIVFWLYYKILSWFLKLDFYLLTTDVKGQFIAAYYKKKMLHHFSNGIGKHRFAF